MSSLNLEVSRIWILIMGRRSKKAKSDKIGYLLIAVVVLILGGIAVFIAMNRGVELDKESMCRVDGQYDRSVVVLDMTDNYNAIQVQQIRHIIENIADNLAVTEQLQLYIIDDVVPSEMKVELSLCNPGDGDGKSEIYSNPKLFKKRWEERFHAPLMAKLQKLSGAYTSTTSPILETVQAVNNIAFPYVRNANQKYKMTIISDMIQNSKELSFFKTKSSKLGHFINSKEYMRVRTDLSQIDVDFVFVRRERFENLQTRPYIDFWAEVLGSMNANVENIKVTDG